MQHIRYNIWVFLIIVIYISLEGNAQSKLSGNVFDSKIKEPLVGVNIYIPETQWGTVSNQDGNYSLALPNKKKVKIQYSFIGYKTILKTVTTDSSEIQLDINLEPVSLKSEEVVISGISSSTQHENAIKIETLKALEIENFGSPSLIEAIASVPGVSVISKGAGVSMPMIRGLSMTNIIVMNNGVKLENYQYSKNHAFIIDEFGIEQVEVIKGPASLLYGSDAVGGVINFIKEKPAQTGKIVGDYTGHYHANTNGICNSLGVKGKNKDLFWGFRAGLKNHADYLDGNRNYVPNTRFNDKSLKANLGLIKPFGSFKLYYDYNRPKLGMCMEQVIPLINERGRKPKWWYQDLTSHIISSRNKLFWEDYAFDINIAYQLNNRTGMTDTTMPGYKLVDANMNTLSYELKTYLPSGEKSEYIVGVQGENRENVNNDAPVQVIPDAIIHGFSVFGFVQQTFFGNLKTQGGIRYDYRMLETSTRDNSKEIKKEYGNISTSLGATYTINKDALFRVNFASAYRTPNIGELTQDGWHGTRYEQGNPDLKAQKNYEADLSFQYHAKSLRMDISWFYNFVRDYIFMSPTNDTLSTGDKIYRHSQSNAILYGGEITLDYAPKESIELQAIYSCLWAKKQDGSHLPFIPPNNSTINAKIKKKQLFFMHNPYIKFGLEIVEKQNRPAMFETETDGFFLVNMGFGTVIHFAQQPINLGIFTNNVLNTTYYTHLSTLKELDFYNLGRNVSFLLKIPF